MLTHPLYPGRAFQPQTDAERDRALMEGWTSAPVRRPEDPDRAVDVPTEAPKRKRGRPRKDVGA